MNLNMRSLSMLAAALAVMATTSTARAAGTIVDVASETGKFNTLLTAAKAAGLAGTLSGKGPFTVFAPTDAAFAKLPAGTVESLLKPENKKKLAAILTYHVVPKRILAGQIPAGRSRVGTVNGRALSVKKHGGVRVNNARVVSADVRASNGVIHVIDRVLLPN